MPWSLKPGPDPAEYYSYQEFTGKNLKAAVDKLKAATGSWGQGVALGDIHMEQYKKALEDAVGKSWEQIEQEEELSREASNYFRKERWSQDVVPDGCPICEAAPAIELFQLVTHLNDQHRLSFLDIAEVLEGVETISLDEHRERMLKYLDEAPTHVLELGAKDDGVTDEMKEVLNAAYEKFTDKVFVKLQEGEWIIT